MQDLLSQNEMMQHVESGDFRLAFVWMSNCGKSYRSRILQNDAGFFWYEVDREIQKKFGFETMEEIASWLWEPSDEWFTQREKLYLEKEEACTHLEWLDTEWKNLVFDTTGSVIYLSDKAKNWLKNECLIVNIDVGLDAIPEMLEKYIQEPKPVSWNGMLVQKAGESQEESLKRCYPELLKDRLRQYKEFSHVTIASSELKDLSAEETLELIASYLPE